jgi:cell pole-organizing protein PopZ
MSDQKTQEPSMEEILASIRRIISEEGGGQTEGEARTAAATPAAPAPASAKEEVLELTEVVAEEEPAKVLEPEPPMPEPATPPPMAPMREPVEAGPGLVSETTAARSTSSLAELATLVARQEVRGGVDIPIVAGGHSIESLVAELLRPLLREWLDANLAPLIDRLVRQEIEKLVRRAQGR